MDPLLYHKFGNMVIRSGNLYSPQPQPRKPAFSENYLFFNFFIVIEVKYEEKFIIIEVKYLDLLLFIFFVYRVNTHVFFIRPPAGARSIRDKFR